VKQTLLMLLLASSVHATPTSCPTGQPKDEAALVQIERRWAQAVEQHDPAVLDCILANNFEEARFNGQLSDRSEMLASAAQHDQVQYELSELHAHVYGDFGYIRGIGVARKNGGSVVVKTRFTDIFIYRDGRWQCVAGHESLFHATAH
jgi:ketosteroid isomerase-like protein